MGFAYRACKLQDRPIYSLNVTGGCIRTADTKQTSEAEWGNRLVLILRLCQPAAPRCVYFLAGPAEKDNEEKSCGWKNCVLFVRIN